MLVTGVGQGFCASPADKNSNIKYENNTVQSGLDKVHFGCASSEVILAAKKLTKNNTEIFIADCQRILNNIFLKKEGSDPGELKKAHGIFSAVLREANLPEKMLSFAIEANSRILGFLKNPENSKFKVKFIKADSITCPYRLVRPLRTVIYDKLSGNNSLPFDIRFSEADANVFHSGPKLQVKTPDYSVRYILDESKAFYKVEAMNIHPQGVNGEISFTMQEAHGDAILHRAEFDGKKYITLQGKWACLPKWYLNILQHLSE